MGILSWSNGCDQRLATIRGPQRRILSRVRCIAWFSLLGLHRFARLVDLEFTADLLRHEFVDVAEPWILSVQLD
jgi:hypothetical protein